MYENDNPFTPWNDPINKDNPFMPHNDITRKDNPFEPWNNLFGKVEDLSHEDRVKYGEQ